MAIIHHDVHPHLNYFLCLESDILGISRWIEFSLDNESVYSIELARLLMTAASEADVLAKGLCRIIDATRSASSINAYQSVLCEAFPTLPDSLVEIPRFGLEFRPWSNWHEPDSPPDWWTGNNKVKHHRAEHFKQANLKNVLNASAGLLVLLILYHRSQGNTHFPQLNLFRPRSFASQDGHSFYIAIPDGASVPWE